MKNARWFTMIATNDMDRTLTVDISGKRYEYWLHDLAYEEHKFELKKRIRSQAQQLQWIKKNSKEYKAL